VTGLRAENAQLRQTVIETRNIAAGNFDRIPELRWRLLEARQDHAYDAIFHERAPLISVRIAIHNRGDLLFGRTIPSCRGRHIESSS
jgi:hypothetical protein